MHLNANENNVPLNLPAGAEADGRAKVKNKEYVFIPSTINTNYILWQLQLIVADLAYFDLKKYT